MVSNLYSDFLTRIKVALASDKRLLLYAELHDISNPTYGLCGPNPNKPVASVDVLSFWIRFAKEKKDA